MIGITERMIQAFESGDLNALKRMEKESGMVPGKYWDVTRTEFSCYYSSQKECGNAVKDLLALFEKIQRIWMGYNGGGGRSAS